MGSSVWLSIWSEDTNSTSSKTDMYLGVYGALGVGQGMCMALFVHVVPWKLYKALPSLHTDRRESIPGSS